MNPEIYQEMATTEIRHWWFAGRRRIIESILVGMKLTENCRILEVGSGTGGNLEMLLKFGTVSAIEKNLWASRYSRTKFGNRVPILHGDFMETAFAGEKYDLICAFDVLEHLPDDLAALRRMQDLLADNGRIILTVPAYRWLWSVHDEQLHHYRRYTRTELLEKLAQIPLNTEFISYFNFLLFPLAMFFRLLDKALRNNLSSKAGNPPGRAANALLYTTFSAERFLLQHRRLPFGLSLLAVVSKRRSTQTTNSNSNYAL